MKKIPKKYIIIPSVLLIVVVAFVVVADNYILPNYVYSPELEVPNVVGQNKDDAIAQLQLLKLQPTIQGTRFDSNFPVDEVTSQKPRAGTLVKENRRIYLIISGGEPKIMMPSLIGKTLRDAKLTVERLGLILSDVEKIRSEFPAETIVEQEEIAGSQLAKGNTVHLKVSVGPKVGKSRVPNLIGETLKGAEKLLRRYSLHLGNVKYLPSKTLLPNTIREQYPSMGTLLNYGDSVDVFVSKGSTSGGE